MIATKLQNLFDSVKTGDEAAAARLRYLLRPVVSRAVRRVVQTHRHVTPLERHVQTLLDDAGKFGAPDAPGSIDRITQAICSETVAQMQSGYAAESALATVLA